MNFKEFESAEKLRGGYYTSGDLAEFLTRWICQAEPERVLEPSCGDGVFLQTLADNELDAEILAFELDESEAAKASEVAKARGLRNCCVRPSDFLGWALAALENEAERFDAVVGNPPFIRYQYLPHVFQDRAESVFRKLGCKFTKHTNAWVSFILACFELLKPGGKLAMVVPAEIIHVTHA